MEATGTKLEQVHVLRHAYRPNESFREILSELAWSGSNGPRLFYGSDELVLNAADLAHHELDAERHDAAKHMARMENAYFQIGNRVDVRDLKSREKGLIALQLVITPPREVSRVLDAFEKIKVGQRRFALGFEATRLYMNIPAEQLVGDDDVDEVMGRINNILANPSTTRRYQVTPLPYLYDHIMSVPKPKPSADTSVRIQAS